MQSENLSTFAGPRQIALSQGKFATVDADDFLRLSPVKWHAVLNSKTKFYAKRKGGYMHHEIFGKPPAGQVVDHINGDGLDNRRENLRFATWSQNASNKLPNGNRSSRSVFEQGGKYMVRLRIKRVNHYGGVFGNKWQAVCAANALMLKVIGPLALLNNVEAANDA